MTSKNSSLRAKVFQQIREDILSGHYQRGDELTEAALGAAYGVSRTPVREALRQLALEGLVELIPNKGAFVTGISSQDIRDIYEIRSRLEGLCARWAAKNITQAQLDEMEEVLYLTDYHVRKEHYEQLSQLDGRFHKLLYEASHSRIMAHQLSGFHQYVQLARKQSLKSSSRSLRSNEEHQRILEALKAHDEELAEKLATEHILNTIDNLNKCIPDER